MAEQLKFSNPMMEKEDEDDADADADADAAGSTARAAASKVDNPLVTPLSPAKSEHQVQMDAYFEEEDDSEEIDEVSPALILFYLFEDATCKSWQPLSAPAHACACVSSRTAVVQGSAVSAKRACS
jgi:hypothetical protein